MTSKLLEAVREAILYLDAPEGSPRKWMVGRANLRRLLGEAVKEVTSEEVSDPPPELIADKMALVTSRYDEVTGEAITCGLGLEKVAAIINDQREAVLGLIMHRDMGMEAAVHLLQEGKAACGLFWGREPKDWPHGQTWVGAEYRGLVSCPRCRELAPPF
jgi:hypothetical protein